MSLFKHVFFGLLGFWVLSVKADLPINPTPPGGGSDDVIKASSSWLKEILNITIVALGVIVFVGVIIYLIIEFFNMRKNQHNGAGGGMGAFSVSVGVGIFIMVFSSFILNLAYKAAQTIGQS